MDWIEGGSIWIDVRDTATGALVRVSGDVDLFTVDMLRKTFEGLEGGPIVDLDLDGCTGLDAAGIHVLVQQRNLASKANRILRLTAASDAALRALESAGQHEFTSTVASRKRSIAGTA